MIRTVLASVALACGFTAAAAQAATITVPCDEGKSIQKRLDSNAKVGDTVEISGTCNEQIVIRTNNVRLVGLDGATIDGGADSSEGNSVIVVRALDVRIAGLTVTGGRNGIVVSRNASAIIGGTGTGEENTINAVGRNGVLITEDGWAELSNNTITNAGRTGVTVSGGSARLSGNTVQGSDRDGLLMSTSIVEFDGTNSFSNNGRWGVLCTRAGVLRVEAIQNFAGNSSGPFANSFGTCSIFADVAFP